MIKRVLLSLMLLFVGCSLTQPKPVAPNEKAFEEEDFYILAALDAQQHKAYASAAELFSLLYEKSAKKEYFYREVQNLLMAKEYNKALLRIDKAAPKNILEDKKLARLKVRSLFALGRLDEARELAVLLAKETNEALDAIMVSNIYTKAKEYKKAFEYLQSAYAKEYNEAILDKMVLILYVNMHKKKEAIAELETHILMHGCSRRLCLRLIGFYSNENNIEGLLSVYKRLYATYKNEAVAQKIIEIYSYKRDYLKLTEFLEANKIDDELLLELYTTLKEYKKAATLAQKLYDERKDPHFLGLSALYTYEAKGKDISKKELQSVILKLKTVLKQKKESLFLNYLGYILIDHEIDPKAGIGYVKEALKMEPNSLYYLDSLAWGYYKIGACKKAKALLPKMRALGQSDVPEINEHIERIKACKSTKRGKKRR